MKVNDLNSISVTNFNLDKTLNSGQSFVWQKFNEYWVGSTIDGLIVLSQVSENELLWQTYPNNNDFNLVRNYLRLDFNFEKVKSLAQYDEYFAKALNEYNGLRLLNQNFYETAISFIASTNKNIPAIRKSIKALSDIAGEKVIFNSMEYSLFPNLNSIANLSINELNSCAFGYRSRYIKETAEILLNWDVQKLYLEEEDVIRNKLLKLPGVGNKVADCILCYSLKFDNVTPLDVWGQRVIGKYYNYDEDAKYERMREFTKAKFGGYAAWIGQYLFEYIREFDK